MAARKKTNAQKRKMGLSRDAALLTAKDVLETEARAILSLIGRLDEGFARAVDLIYSATGKVIVTGMGKSGIICQKIASTLASTGTSAFFLHPAEGMHGDLGVIMKNDILLAVSNSGETEELIKMIPLVKRMGIKMIAMTGKPSSTLARHAEVSLDVGVEEEACTLGDALAVALIEKRGFKEEDFASLHPAGSLGRRFLRVSELMHTGESVPRVNANTRMKDAILEMTAKRLGITGVFRGEKLVGVITDGDLRRALERGDNIINKKAADVMTGNPKTITDTSLAEAALKKMEEHSITALFVLYEKDGSTAGVVHLHDLIKAGVV